MCITAAVVANAPVIGAALGLGGGVAVGTRMAFVKPRGAAAAARAPPTLRRRAEKVAPPPEKPPAIAFYSSFPERDD
jgi:hypothetical protein